MSIPTPLSAPAVSQKKPKTRLLIVLGVVLTVALVAAAVLANYFAP
jgi:uncharacterized protein involved in exopolysaccharide biosynthesis